MVLEIVRWREWSEGKIPNFLLILLYLSLSQNLAFEAALASVLSVLLFLSLFFSFSYALNDYCDRDGGIARMRARWAAAVLTVLFLGGFSLLFLFPALSVTIGCSMYVLSISYSAKPMRLKERGLAGIITSAVAQQTLPAILVFSLLPSNAPEMILFTLFLTALGFRRIFEHQVKDFRADRKAKVKTLAQTLGLSKAKRISTCFTGLEELSLFMFLAWIGWNSLPLLILPLSYAALCFLSGDMREHATYYMSRLFAPCLVLLLLVLSDLRYLLALPIYFTFTYSLFLKSLRFLGDKI